MNGDSAAGSALQWEPIEAPGAELAFLRNFIPMSDADDLFAALRADVSWRQDFITIYGKEHLVPRLQQWYGNPGIFYTWSGIRLRPEPWTEQLLDIRGWVERASDASFNTVLLNLYRNGSDTVSWHSDDEPELGRDPIIASISLGVERDFKLRHRRKEHPDVNLPLGHGSLLVMSGKTQENWLHSIPRRKRVSAERINLTFRTII